MMLLIAQTLYFLLPAYMANMAPVVAHRLNFLPRLAIPIDGRTLFRGVRMLGDSKTWRGVIVGISTAMFVGLIQYFLWQFNVIRLHSVIDFSSIDPLAFGLIGGVGALGGDMVKSAIKRQFKIKPGDPWPIFDQLDFVIGYLVMTSFLVGFHTDIFVTALLLTIVLHPLVNILAYSLKIKRVWW